MAYHDGLDILAGWWHLCRTLLVSTNKANYSSLLRDPSVQVIAV